MLNALGTDMIAYVDIAMEDTHEEVKTEKIVDLCAFAGAPGDTGDGIIDYAGPSQEGSQGSRRARVVGRGTVPRIV